MSLSTPSGKAAWAATGICLAKKGQAEINSGLFITLGHVCEDWHRLDVKN